MEEAVRQQLDSASASVCKYKLGCAGSGVEVGFVNECTLLHCFVNASILAKPMDLIWKRDFVKEFRRPCKSVKRCSGAVFSSEAPKKAIDDSQSELLDYPVVPTSNWYR